MRSSSGAPFLPKPRFTWPHGAKCAAMLCFDVDGETTALSERVPFTGESVASLDEINHWMAARER